jgi:ketosteroid isomerase-like protein
MKTTLREDSAVVATSLTIHLVADGAELKVPIRWTVGLRRTAGKWMWLHRHASAAADSQADGAAYPTN